MEAIFIYIIKTSGLITLFYLAYHILLRKETFFTSNRWFLLSGLITSIVLPFVVYTKIIWVASTTSATPVNFTAPINATQTIPVEQNWLDTHLNLCLVLLYVSIITLLLLKFVFDFYSLKRVIKGKTIQNQADFKFVDISENIAPFSFFSYIVYNSSLYNPTELENILEHEKIHSEQNHTTDVLIARMFCIVFWFNPIIWLYKKAILQNLEFIADAEALKKIADKKAYQYTLLKITTHENCVAITNHFYQSLIKKRIVMLNKNQSKKKNYWKYALILPLLGAFVFLFQVKVIAQEKESKTAAVENVKSDQKNFLIYNIKKNTTDKELDEITQKLKESHEIIIAFSEVKRNSDHELIGIKVDIKRINGKSQIMQINGNEAIKPFGVVVTKNSDGSKTVNLQIDEKIHQPVDMTENQIDQEDYNIDEERPVPPTPPTPPNVPNFPNGPMPVANVDLSKMPKAPMHPLNVNDEKAMKKFNKEMAEFSKKMESFQPDMSSYEKEVEAVMAKREAIYEKEMAKFDIEMKKFDLGMKEFDKEMKKFNRDMEKYNKQVLKLEK
ncbi:peptidase M56 [Flavobacterium sp. F-65]|uniref:Peptidase M56 n=1 Tax=Flavobacterium pisciphilum TaxID=2893755 RepID=A0ABS8MZT1_9FLAO|nr:M56 family metallopeptidase [Flavobacterium sp. F-65]MCC9074290.1 peptidase M56 [Flavobacterium sp. F-65]